jgi:glycosyltransferase involved in cell wall biosynthesis
MAAGNAVIAHDNVYNRWVAGPGNAYFHDRRDLEVTLSAVLSDPVRLRAMGRASRERFREEFTWDHIGAQYDRVLGRCLASSKETAAEPMR